MASKTLIFCLLQIIIMNSAAQRLSIKYTGDGICQTILCNSLENLRESLKDCIVILGNLKITILEQTTKEHYKNMSFPKLREVTGYFAIYWMHGLDSVGTLFPNLARIRGQQLLYNYALIVYDMPGLIEIGLYSLVKIDRGDIILKALPQACYIDTVDWKTIAPRSRHAIGLSDMHMPTCNNICTCSDNPRVNFCWNNKKCQRFLEGPESDVCNKQCLGCRKTNRNECSLCRYYTHKGNCVSRCPNGTLLLRGNQYCITIEECNELGGWPWNSSCVFECPIDYKKANSTNGITCKSCTNCHQTCPNQIIQTTSSIQAVERCVYINGSLTIHVGTGAEAMKELRTYLSRIKEVSDYVLIYGSNVITSLDFLPSLRLIKGEKLKNDRHSLIIHDMFSLHTIFDSNVTKNLKIDRGTLKVYNNPVLCMSQIDKLKSIFPEQPNEKDIPVGANGYSGACEEVPVNIQARGINETSAIIMFVPIGDPDVHYSILYVRLPPAFNGSVVPEACSDTEWFVVNVPNVFGNNAVVLTSLKPASLYAFCIEIFDSVHQRISRSRIYNFTTHVGIPEPPFIVELVASSFDVIVVRWVNHKDYRPHITRFELDVFLINSNDAVFVDHCRNTVTEFTSIDYSRHAMVMRPPPEYSKTCETLCGVLSNFYPGAFVEDYFDICSELNFGCHGQVDIPPVNSSFGNYINTLALNLSKSQTNFQVANLAPFRDYRFRLRACIGDICSRSSRGVVRTLKSSKADIPIMISASVDEKGHVNVKWEPPNVTNGPILAYIVEIKLGLDIIDVDLPQAWCLLANTTSFTARTIVAPWYKVRICSTSLASVNTCCEWQVIEGSYDDSTWLWSGAIFGLILYILSTVIGILYKSRTAQNDLEPLVEDTWVANNESDPPRLMRSEVVPLYLFRINEESLE